MSDFILIEGDKAIFLPNFGAAMVVVRPGDLKGNGPATIKGKKICIDGDEKQVSVSGCMYMTPQYSIPGTGTLKIDALAGDQKASKTKTGGKMFYLKAEILTPNLRCKIQHNSRHPVLAHRYPIPPLNILEKACLLLQIPCFRELKQ